MEPLKGKRTCFRSFLWCCLFPILASFLILATLARTDVLYDKDHDDNGFQWSRAQQTLESCTYQQLHDAFGEGAPAVTKVPASDSTPTDLGNPVQAEKEEQCWRTSDRILRVPQSAILNFHTLVPLGAGNKGGVYMVFLNLDDRQKPCKAVYKTDMKNTNLCEHVWRNPLAADWSRTKSCLSAHLWPFGSSMPGELAGGTIFQAFRQYAVDHPEDPIDASGIMPTWGVVLKHRLHHSEEDRHHQEHHPHSHHPHSHRQLHALRGGDDRMHVHGGFPPVLGVIMPYQTLASLNTHVATRFTASQMASLLHSSAQGLAFVHELGLAHQDLLARNFKNIGLVRDGRGKFSHSIIFDWGYTAYDDAQDHSCKLGRACDFCVEDYFPRPRVGGDHGERGSRRRTLDCEHLRSMVSTLLDSVQDAETKGKSWKAQLESQVDCSRSTQDLADFLARVAQDHA